MVLYVSLKVIVTGKYDKKDHIVLKIAVKLLEKFSDVVVGVERVDGWDGANLRVIVREESPELVDRIIDAIYDVVEELGVYGEVVPEIVQAEGN